MTIFVRGANDFKKEAMQSKEVTVTVGMRNAGMLGLFCSVEGGTGDDDDDAANFCDKDGISLRREEVTIRYLNSSSKALSSRFGNAVLSVA